MYIDDAIPLSAVCHFVIRFLPTLHLQDTNALVIPSLHFYTNLEENTRKYLPTQINFLYESGDTALISMILLP